VQPCSTTATRESTCFGASAVSETRKLAAILVSDIVGYSRLAGADEDRTLARLRTLRSDLIDPTIAVHHGRIIKRTGDGSIIEFRSVVDAVNCAIEVQRAMVERNAEVTPEKRIEFRIGIHLGDVVEEADGDLMGDGVNIAARLEGVANPGAICLSEQAYWQVKGRLDLKVSDLGPQTLRNIADPIRVYSLQVDVPAHAKPEPRPSSSEKSGPPRLSIVVLPFANIGGDTEQDYFVDGITESLTTDLSRMRGMLVIGRSTAFTFKGKSVDLKQTGRELNVRYVLEGSVQRGGNRMRVNVQLIDAVSSNHLWADRFDKPLADLFDMQDEIVARLANQLGAELTGAEAHRAERTQTPDSMDHYFQGSAWLNRGINPENMKQARGFFQRASELDPGNLDALLGIGQVDSIVAANFLSDDRAARLASAEATTAKVLSLRPNDALAHEIMGSVLNQTNRAVQGIAELERALALDPNRATAHGEIGLAKLFVGRFEETEAHENEAVRLSPRDSFAWLWLQFAGGAKVGLGAYEEAVSRFRRSIELNRNNPLIHFFLASALANLGKLDGAQAETRVGLALDPTFTIQRFRLGPESDSPVFLEGRERMIGGMRNAGVPEG
jgi:TolB-like protein/class 3 adenylate cyclase/Flp pilus assembly protein TadD